MAQGDQLWQPQTGGGGGGGGGHLQRRTIQSMTLTLKHVGPGINCGVVTTEKYLWFYIWDDMPPL